MKRAAIIVLDGLGIGAAPDQGAYGDEGSDTLGNVAQAVGGLRLPNLERLGLGLCRPLRGMSRPAAPGAAHGVALPRSYGKDSTTGHWEICGVLLERPFRTYPQGFPVGLLEEFARRTGRGRIGNKAASGTGIIAELARRAPAHRQVDRLHLGGLGLPGRGARSDGPAGGAVPGARGGARAVHGRARGEPGNRATVHRPAGRLPAFGTRKDFSIEPVGTDAARPAGGGGRRPGGDRQGGRSVRGPEHHQRAHAHQRGRVPADRAGPRHAGDGLRVRQRDRVRRVLGAPERCPGVS